MAPKRQQAKALKRPAAAINCRQQPRVTKAGSPGVTKKPAAVVRANCLRPRAILKALSQFEEIPKHLHDSLKRLIVGGVNEGRHPRIETIVAALKELLQDGEDRLLSNLRDAQKSVDSLADDKSAREQAEDDAETELAKLTQALADGKLAIKSSGKNVDAALKSLNDAKLAQKACETEIQTLRSKRELLQNTAMSTYGPLKEASAGGAKGQKQLNILCKVGKDFGFHDVLVGALPAILRKQPDKRRTFDGLAMTHLEKEFERQKAKLDSAVKGEAASLAERSAALRNAQDSVANAKGQQQSSAQAVEEISNSLSRAKETLSFSRKHVRNYARDACQAERVLKSAKSKLNSFRKGPLAAFGELQTYLSPVEFEDMGNNSAAPPEASVAVAEMMPEASVALAEMVPEATLASSAAVLPVAF